MGPDDMLHTQVHSQQLFSRAILRVKQATAPSDEIALEVHHFQLSHVLHWLTGQTLTVFLEAALSKKYTNPSSDILSILAGMHDADTVLSDFVATLDAVIRNGRSCERREPQLYQLLTSDSGPSPKSSAHISLHNCRWLPHSTAVIFYSPGPLSFPHEGMSFAFSW